MLDARMVRPIARPGHSTIMATFRSCETAPVEAADQTERRADHEGDEDSDRGAQGAALVGSPAAPRPWGLDGGHEIRTFGLSQPYAMSSRRLTIQHLS
jgi:hypothetical protein